MSKDFRRAEKNVSEEPRSKVLSQDVPCLFKNGKDARAAEVP